MLLTYSIEKGLLGLQKKEQLSRPPFKATLKIMARHKAVT